MTLLIVYIVLTVGVSFVCSLLESAFLSSRISTLTVQKEKGRKGPALLLWLKRHRLDDSLSSILTLNTIANTLGAVLAGSQAHSWAETQAWASGRIDLVVGIFSGVLTFLILSVSEIIPKTLGAVHAPRLSGFVGYVVWVLTKIMAPVLIFTRSLTRLFTRGRRTSMSRGEVAAYLAIAAQEGAIEGHESRLVANILRFEQIPVEDVMTPRTVATMLPGSTSLREFLAESTAKAYSRIPIYDQDRDHVTGYVLQRDVLRALSQHASRDRPISDYRRDIVFIPEQASLGSALRQLLAGRDTLAMVVDEHGGVAGLVTREDLIETVLGAEMLDESDEVADLRKVAHDIRDRRIQSMQERQQLKDEPEAIETAPPGDETAAAE